MNVRDMIAAAREEMNFPASGGYVGDDSILGEINRAYRKVYGKMVRSSPSYFSQFVTLTPAANTEEHVLPDRVKDRKIVGVCLEQGSGSTLELTPYDVVDYRDNLPRGASILSDASVGGLGARVASIRKNMIHFNPMFSDGTRTVRIYFLEHPIDLHFGTMDAWTAGTISMTMPANAVLADATTVPTLLYPPASYIGHHVRLIGGSGGSNGSQVEITAYTPAARYLFLRSAPSGVPVPDATTIYSIQPLIPDEYHDLIVIQSAIQRFTKQGDAKKIRLLQEELHENFSVFQESHKPRFVGRNYITDLSDGGSSWHEQA